MNSDSNNEVTDHHAIANIIRRIAGLFVMLSLALGYFVHPGWFGFTAFVGFNLFQSSFTGFCPMEKILQKFGVGK